MLRKDPRVKNEVESVTSILDSSIDMQTRSKAQDSDMTNAPEQEEETKEERREGET